MAEPSVAVTSQISLSETTNRREERLSSVGQIQLRTDLTTTSWALWVLLLGGAIVTSIEARGHAAAALLWALACLVVGNIAGFLFAIPRVPRTAIPSKTAEDPGTSLETVAASRAAGERGFGLGINTNLEEISDWLTKILVGVGLIELRSLPDAVRRMGYYIGQGLGQDQQTIASGIVIYFLGLGFLCGYLLTRMFLGPAFRLADQATTIGLEEKLQQTRALAVAAQAGTAINSDLDTAIQELAKADHPPARLHQLISTLEAHRRADPLHRKLNIVLARLYAEGNRNLDEALRVLQDFVRHKSIAQQSNDRDTSDAFFNIACYYSKKMEGTSGDPRKELEEKGISAVKNSLDILPENALDVQVDADLAELRKSERLQELVQRVIAKLPKPNSGPQPNSGSQPNS